MNITKNEIDALNAELKVTVERADYTEKVEETLKKYRKTAKIPGFRPGKVPMGMIRKQYEKALIFDEVNNLIQKSINDFIQKEELSILGNPLPKTQEDLDWDADSLNFEFELGLAPDFDLDLKNLDLEAYKIKVNDEEIDKYITNFQQRFGKLSNLDKSTEECNLHGSLVKKGEESQGDEDKKVALDISKTQKPESFVGVEIGTSLELDPKNLFGDEKETEFFFGDNAEGTYILTVSEVSKLEKAEINKELFDKVYPDANLESEEAFRAHISAESEKMYVSHTDNQLLQAAIEDLLENTNFELPSEFLVKWVQFSSKEIDNEEAAKAELEKSRKGLRYQLIESKVAEKYKISVAGEEVEAQAKESIKQQMAMYGYNMGDGEELDNYAKSALSNQQEYERIMNQVFQGKLLAAVKENAKIKEKEVSFEEFIELTSEKKED